MTESDAEAGIDPVDSDPDRDRDHDPDSDSTPSAAAPDSDADPETALDIAEDADATLGVGVVTIAANRTLDADAAGETVETALENAGHSLSTREHVTPSHDRVQSIVLRVIERRDVDVVITAGGASVEPDDIVIEAVEPLLDKRLPAFTHLFTSLAYEESGTRVLAARTLAGIAEGTPVFCLPGNEDAAQLATDEIILPEAPHLVTLAREDESDDDDAEADEPDE